VASLVQGTGLQWGAASSTMRAVCESVLILRGDAPVNKGIGTDPSRGSVPTMCRSGGV
jgi:hypothetical protein